MALVAGALALASIALLRVLVPDGADTAAHDYQTWRWVHSGFQLWDNYWYDGHYSFVNYSLLYYPLAGVIGQFAVILATVAASGALFARLVADRLGIVSPWPACAFAITASLAVWLGGEYPFALGMALALTAVTLARRRGALAALAALGVLLASPLAFVLLVVSLMGMAAALDKPWRLVRTQLAIGLGICIGAAAVLELAFPVGGRFPFSPWALVQVVFMSALAVGLSLGLRGVGVIRGIFAAAALLAVAAYLVPSPLGGNATRPFDYIAAPLILILLVRQCRERDFRRVVAVLLGVAALAAQLAPTLITASRNLETPSAQPGFWAGGIQFLRAHSDPDFRVEAVDSTEHWAAYYLPRAGIPIVRGWFRQADFPQDAVLYKGRLTALAYRAWLRRNGVRYVVLPREHRDYSARAEGRLLRSGASGLRPVYHDGPMRIFELPHATPMLVAPAGGRADLLHLGHASLALSASEPGRYGLAIRYTPYWRVAPIASACVRRTARGTTSLIVARPGPIRLRFDPTFDHVLDGGGTAGCVSRG